LVYDGKRKGIEGDSKGRDKKDTKGRVSGRGVGEGGGFG